MEGHLTDMQELGPLLPLILLFALFWLFIIRPQSNRRRELSRVQGALQQGQRVMTGAGLIATVVDVEDDQVVLEVAPGVNNRYARQAIVRVLGETTTPSREGGGEGADDNTSSGGG